MATEAVLSEATMIHPRKQVKSIQCNSSESDIKRVERGMKANI